MIRKFTNIKVGIELDSLLSRESLFQGEGYKAISNCEYLLNLISIWSEQTDDCWAGIHSERLKSLFRGYKLKYTEVLNILERLEIIATPRKGFYNRAIRKGWVSRFQLTSFGLDLLLDANREYLRKLHNDPKLRKQLDNNRRAKKCRLPANEDYVVRRTNQNILDLIKNQEVYDLILRKFKEDLKNDKTRSTDRKKRRENHVHASIKSIEKREYEKIKRCETDGRLYHPFVMMKSDFRPAFTLRGKKFLRDIDIRSCFPSFFAKYLFDITKLSEYLISNPELEKALKSKNKELTLELTNNSIYPNNKYYNNIYNLLTTNQPFKLLHYLGENVTTFEEEVRKWNIFWNHPIIDPKQQIITDLGIKCSRKQIKKCINSAINGSPNKAFYWIKENFPVLFSIWQKTNPNETGPRISKLYESQIILDPELFHLAESLDLEILTSHDGICVFGSETDPELDSKAAKLKDCIQERSFRLFGLTIQVKIDEPEVPAAGTAGPTH
jgi:hypothetical protein